LGGRNFVKAIAGQLEKTGGPLRVVKDQVSCPTYTGHLADALVDLMGREQRGIVHVSSSGHCTWHAFACAIAGKVKPGADVVPVTSAECPRPAARPSYSVLDKSRYESWTGKGMPTWQEGLEAYLEEAGRA
jgi:dTDP-4-dehydrorhamnose reductase